MSVTVVNDYRLKPDGDTKEAKGAARDLVEHFRTQKDVQLSLWLEDTKDPLHHFHITVFDTKETFERIRGSDAIARFVERLYPHMDRSTHVAPLCDVWLAGGSGVKPVRHE